MKDIDLTANDIDDEIDKYLKKLFETREYKLFSNDLYDYHVMNNDGGVIDETMIEQNLIRIKGDTRALTSWGIEVSKQGGWKAYLNKGREKEKRESETQAELKSLTKQELELSIRSMQVNFTQIKYWWLILIITIIASSVLAALFQSLF